MFKDSNTINHKKKQKENIKLLADAINTNVEVPLLFGGSIPIAKEHKSDTYDCASDMDDAEKKIMCKCMYHYNNGDESQKDKCAVCENTEKWENISKIAIINYECPTKLIREGMHGVDLLFEEQDGKGDKIMYAVEVKPENSNETIIRMISEILTYSMDENFEGLRPAICFFENQDQHRQYKELLQSGNEDFLLLLDYVDVFCFVTSGEGKIKKFDIKRLNKSKKQFKNGGI